MKVPMVCMVQRMKVKGHVVVARALDHVLLLVLGCEMTESVVGFCNRLIM